MRVHLLIATVLLTSCAINGRSGQAPGSDIKSGIFHTGEYAHLETPEGDVFELRVPDTRDRERLYALAPITREATEPQCLALRVAGKVNGATELGRPIFVVSGIIKAEASGCVGNGR